jgi:DNA-binding MarR family transcriptional regulator
MTPVIEPGLSPAVPDRSHPDHTELDDATARLSVALGRLTRVMRRGGQTGLGPGSVSALATLVRCGPMRLGDLAAREGVAPPTLTRIVAGLEELGYVFRVPDPDDRRATRVESTPAAAELVAGVGSARLTQLRARVDGLADSDLQVLLRALPVIESLAADEG